MRRSAGFVVTIVAMLPMLPACWSGGARAPASVRNVTPPHAPTTVPLPAHSVWIGRYECAQGVTALQLRLDIEPGGHARAIFDFGPLADNPTVPNGSYRLRGTAVPSGPGFDNAVDVSLQPDEWIDRPDRYEMVGLSARIDAARRGIRGRILDDRCAWLDAKRSE